MTEHAHQKTAATQDKILYQIKRLGPHTAKALSLRLDMTTMGVRQHLQQLEAAGLIESTEPEARKRGRPVRHWQLTQAGHNRFPDAHAQVTAEIIVSVRELLGDDALDQVIDARARQSMTVYQAALTGLPDLKSRLEALAQVRSDEGYMAEVIEEGGSYLLVENHCPICVAARTCQGFCRTELESFCRLFEGEARVEREDYLLDGARRCSYRITPLPAAN